MVDYSTLILFFWAFPVILQLVLPLLILCCWLLFKVPIRLFHGVAKQVPIRQQEAY